MAAGPAPGPEIGTAPHTHRHAPLQRGPPPTPGTQAWLGLTAPVPPPAARQAPPRGPAGTTSCPQGNTACRCTGYRRPRRSSGSAADRRRRGEVGRWSGGWGWGCAWARVWAGRAPGTAARLVGEVCWVLQASRATLQHPPASPHLTPSDARRAGRNHPHGGAVATRRLPGGLVHAPAVQSVLVCHRLALSGDAARPIVGAGGQLSPAVRVARRRRQLWRRRLLLRRCAARSPAPAVLQGVHATAVLPIAHGSNAGPGACKQAGVAPQSALMGLPLHARSAFSWLEAHQVARVSRTGRNKNTQA